MRITQQKEKQQRLDILSFTSTFPEDYLPYISSYHRKAPYLVWEERTKQKGNHSHRKCRKWKCSNAKNPCRRCSRGSLLLTGTIVIGLLLLGALIAASVYLGWLTHHRNSSTTVSLTGKLRVVEGDQFTPQLLDPTSKEFKEKATKYEALIGKVYQRSRLSNALVKVKIWEFHEGSLEVLFFVTLDDPTFVPNGRQNLSSAAKEILKRELASPESPLLGNLKIDLESLYVMEEEDPLHFEPLPITTVQRTKPSTTSTTQSVPSATRSSTTTLPSSTATPPNLESHRIREEEINLNQGPWRPLMMSEIMRESVERGDKVIPNLFTTHAPKASLPVLYRDPDIRRGLRKHVNNTTTENRTDELPERTRLNVATTTLRPPVREVSLLSPVVVLNRNKTTESEKNTTSSELRFVSGFSVVRAPPAPPSSTTSPSSTAAPATVTVSASVSESARTEEIPVLRETDSVPVLISDSHSPPARPGGTRRRLSFPRDKLPPSGPNGNQGLVLEKKEPEKPIEIPVEASLNLKRPMTGQGFVVAVDEVVIPELLPISVSTTKRPNDGTATKKAETSTELTVGASLFIRNSRAQIDQPARPNIPYRIRKPTTKANYFSPSPTPTKKFVVSPSHDPTTTMSPPPHFPGPELTVNVPFHVRGSSKGQAYLPLSKPNRQPAAIEKNDTMATLNATSVELKLPKNINETQVSDQSGGHGGVPKIISQYNPYNQGPPTGDSDFKGSIGDEGLSVRDKYEILQISKPFFHSRPENISKHSTLKPDFTTTITLEEIFTGTTNEIRDTTEPIASYAPTKKPNYNAISPTKIRYDGGNTDDVNLQSIATTAVKKCKEKDEFMCVSTKTCIAKSKTCNRQKDCPDASDEFNCSCADYLKTRIFRSKICDGLVDCWDASDENNCPWCSPEKFICPGAKMCVNQSKVCDGTADCPGAEDESHCVKLIEEGSDTKKTVYRQEGHLVLRKNGQWGKLCVSNFPMSSWTVEDLGKAVCNALSFRGLISVKEETDPFEDSKTGYFTFQGLQSPLPGLSIPLLEKATCSDKRLVKVTCNSLECGLRPLSLTFRRRIVGGQSSQFGSWPWQVALYKEGEFQCGAVIIKDQWIMSAGHCFYHSRNAHWTARMGLLRRGTEIPSPYEQIANITHIHLHPQYVDRGFINDIVLLKLDKPIHFSDHIRPICMPQITEDMRTWEGQMCTVVGWGKLFELGRIFPDTLQEVQLPIISTEECRKRTSFLPLYKITDNMFCAGYENGGRDACLGDSGGPYMCQRPNGRWSLVGVTSNGDGCGRPGRPGVYTKVVNYLEWIHSVTENDTPATTEAIKTLCEGHRCPLGKCLPRKKVCDGVMDCWDGSDEGACS